ncbi:MAG: glycosyltransferase [Deltaproteobacteria bacterium]|nr:glycosyltransferase [Deltaproteobacteria bacterium]
MSAISVVTAAYQRPKMLARAIASVRGQTFADYEHIIVDDGSAAPLWPTVAPFAREDRRIIFARQANAGQAAALNLAIAMARSPFVAFLDDDDEYAPTHLARRVAFLAKHPSVDLVWGGARVVGPRARQFVADLERPGKRIHFSQCHLLGTFVVRRAILRRVRGLRQLVSMDYDLYQRIDALGAKVVQAKWPTLVYHVEGDDRVSLRSKNIGANGQLAKAPIGS